MTITVEDGSVVSGANSYGSVADCDTYHAALGNTTWTGTAAAKEQALLRAMAWIETQLWKGNKTEYDNPLAWPRDNVSDEDGYTVPDDEVPARVVNCLYEAALIELLSAGALRPALERGGMVTSFSLDGVFSESYSTGAPAGTSYSVLTGLLRGLTKSISFISTELA